MGGNLARSQARFENGAYPSGMVFDSPATRHGREAFVVFAPFVLSYGLPSATGFIDLFLEEESARCRARLLSGAYPSGMVFDSPLFRLDVGPAPPAPPDLSSRRVRAAARARRPPPCAGRRDSLQGRAGRAGREGPKVARPRGSKPEKPRARGPEGRKTEGPEARETKGPRAREGASSSVVRASARRAEGRWFDSTLAHEVCVHVSSSRGP
jgi:hypothetical protein